MTANSSSPRTAAPVDTDAPRSAQFQALKSTSIIGGSSAAVLVIRMVRIKVMALLLGPAGIGLEALYDAVITFIRGLFDLGISSSGVRQIAAAAGSGDERVIATTVYTLRRTCLVLGTLSAAALFLGRNWVSQLAFGTVEYGSALGWLSLSLLIGAIAGGQGALLQGLRRIGDLATMNILGALAGAVFSIPVVYVWGRAGIPAYMILGSAAALVVSTIYARRVRTAPVRISRQQVTMEAAALLKLGLAFMSSGLISTAALFAIRSLITREMGIESAGQFQAASSLSLVYVGFVLQAMGTDFYPRLTAVANANHRCNQTVNEQAEISLLLAWPGILATLALAPWVVQLFYSAKFAPAAEILAWQIVGMLLRLVSWPMGFILLAKGKGMAMICTDTLAYGIYVVAAWAGLKLFGLPGTGMAFLGLYIFHVVLIYVVVHRLTRFRWSARNSRLIVFASTSSLVALGARLALLEPWGTLAGLVMAVVVTGYCVNGLVRVIGAAELRRYRDKLPFLRFLTRKAAA